MPLSFIHDAPAQRVVFAPGALSKVREETERLGITRVLIIATPGSGARLGARVRELLGSWAAGLHAAAAIHTPESIVQDGVRTAQELRADALVATGGGSAIGLAKAIAHEMALPIIAVPTTYSGSEATAIFGISAGERKAVRRDPQVLPRTVLYDPELTYGLPPGVTAASGMNAVAHCVEALWVAERTPITVAFAEEGLRRLVPALPRAVADGADRDARAECLAGAWLAGAALAAGNALHHKLAHALGGYGLPHAETHAIVLPHVMRFNLQEAPEARQRLAQVFQGDPVAALDALLQSFPIPQRLREVGFERGTIEDAAGQIDKLGITSPRPASAADVQVLLNNAY